MNRAIRTSGFIWILPALVVSVGLIYYCIIYTGYISTLNWDGVSPDKISVGLKNYVMIFGDRVFWKAMIHTIIFFVVTFVFQVFLGLLFAVLLHSKVKVAAVYKVVVFLPVVLAPATMAPVFRQIYSPTGEFNTLLSHIGLGFLQQPWLGQSSTSLSVIMSIAIWSGTGISFILYFAAMSQIENEILEAARIDGAGNIRTIVSIVWPGLRGTTVAIAILTAIGSLKTFDIPWLVSQAGPNYSTEFLGTFIYREGVPLNAVGFAAALSVMLLILAVAIAIILRLGGRERGIVEDV
ncbi:ABC transporter permease [Frondihabitans sp. PAMC 28766]|uniref:carbohydrate ABC transporter permease n=1 Tax=Frondihabitans sp. PAMC 28766 TaxID=1795630 RepID=UPI00078C00B5|nr:sugar ABC transporter permease [Frondihabitans sp. PAMC 28766]AMM21574.1 ABC transporter permease [Frondihabitans sp. PAMC 28766]